MPNIKMNVRTVITVCIVVFCLIYHIRSISRPNVTLISQNNEHTQSRFTNLEINSGEGRPLRFANKIITEYNSEIRLRFNELVSRKAAPDDPELLSLIRDMMDPPSEHMVKLSRELTHTPQSEEVLKLLHNKRNGFFIEVGGLDGERSSNTIALEQKLRWNGLLIEMDPFFYTQLLGKNRKSWSINACLSPYPYATEMDFVESFHGLGALVPENSTSLDSHNMHKVPCFPLESMLLALDTTEVDFFSLDVEGFELEILKTVDFDKFDISVLAVEYAHGRSGKDEYASYMKDRGYVVHKDLIHKDPVKYLFVNDFIFIKDPVKN